MASLVSDAADAERAEILVDSGGVAFARTARPRPFFVNIARLSSPDDVTDDRFLELTFNPEYAEIDGTLTDVLVRWGPREEVLGWISSLIAELGLEVCPAGLDNTLRMSLFNENSKDVVQIDESNPWKLCT